MHLFFILVAALNRIALSSHSGSGLRGLISVSLPTWQEKETKPPPNATLQVTGAVGWRREGLVYKKNEVHSFFYRTMITGFGLSFSESYFAHEVQSSDRIYHM